MNDWATIVTVTHVLVNELYLHPKKQNKDGTLTAIPENAKPMTSETLDEDIEDFFYEHLEATSLFRRKQIAEFKQELKQALHAADCKFAQEILDNFA